MKYGILKRAIVLCIFGGIMAFTLAACGDSEDKNEGQEIIQDNTQESEEEPIEMAENEEVANAVNSSENIVSVAHVSSSGNSGNGSTTPVFKPGAGTQPAAGPQQPQQPQSNTGTSPSTVIPTVHTHNFQGGDCSTPATCSCGATGNYGSHNWVTNTIHHWETGHYEYGIVGTEDVVVGYNPSWWETSCDVCGKPLGTKENTPLDYGDPEVDSHVNATDHKRIVSYEHEGEPIYETRDRWDDIWIVDSWDWDETVTTCSICSARQ